MLQNVAFAAANEMFVYIIKRDHTAHVADFQSGQPIESVPGALAGKKIVDMQMYASSAGVLILTDEGEVIPWRAPAPPEDLGKARAIRIGEKVAAAQMMDGSWKVFGRTEQAESLKKIVEPLGPLKDLAFGSHYFVAIQ